MKLLYHLFPFKKVSKGENIVLYGAGEVGQWYLAQMRQIGYANVVAISDRNWDKYPDMGVPLIPPGDIKNVNCDKVVISIENRKVAERARKQLVEENGVPANKIVMACDSLAKEPCFSKPGKISWETSNVPLASCQGMFEGVEDREEFKYQRSVRYYLDQECIRKPWEELAKELSVYDVISFDIFDTALLRKVEFPADVFHVLGIEMGVNNFKIIRQAAERYARNQKLKTEGHTEVTITDIYDVLEEKYAVDRCWESRECELEKELSLPNPYILKIYQKLREQNKTVVFMSNMYLPKAVIEEMLEKAGYVDYDAFLLSNEEKLTKADGSLQALLRNLYPHKYIVHVGDNEKEDCKASREAGLQAVHNRDVRLKYQDFNLDNLSGSFYRAIFNNTINNGVFDANIQFEHGFRVGGILTVGYCKYIYDVAKKKHIDKILFCSNSCDTIYKVYEKYFNGIACEKLDISDYAIMNVSAERFLHAMIGKFVFPYLNKYKDECTIADVLRNTGFDYLVPYLDEDDIEEFLFASQVKKELLEEFFLKHIDIVCEHNRMGAKAAVEYFKRIIGDAKSVLIVDSFWDDDCIEGFRYFVKHHLPELTVDITGMLMCTNRDSSVNNGIISGKTYAFINSPFSNMDMTRYLFPRGNDRKFRNRARRDRANIGLLFASDKPDVVGYCFDDNSVVASKYLEHYDDNLEEILDMQKGILYFADLWNKYSGHVADFEVASYTAFSPLLEAIKKDQYNIAVYNNYSYEVVKCFDVQRSYSNFVSDFYDQTAKLVVRDGEIDEGKDKILFVADGMGYNGAAHSLLRMCKVAKNLGYNPVVWSRLPGPFVAEFNKYGMNVNIVPERELESHVETIKQCSMAVCNTIVVHKYAQLCERHIPTVWYIREAKNIPIYFKDRPEYLPVVQSSKSLCSVSKYAAKYIKEHTENDVLVVHNCVEDTSKYALDYQPGTGDKVKFVQFGVIEYRKGYDVLFAAYKALSPAYKEKAEIYFAGAFVNSETPYASYLFQEIKDEKNIHYLGVIKGEKDKTETLSSMDVVVVASRDESCSLVALEGTMLGRPLIVTENVGAKYMVHEDNGIVVPTGDVEATKLAMMKMIDNKDVLAKMGASSRRHYEEQASMESYEADMKKLYMLGEKKDIHKLDLEVYTSDVVVSLVLNVQHLDVAEKCLKSLLKQTTRPKKILVWMSQEDFPAREDELPGDIRDTLANTIFEVHWTDRKKDARKKNIQAIQSNGESPVILVEDNVEYNDALISKLVKSYQEHPDCVSGMSATLITFKHDGRMRSYEAWRKGYASYKVLDVPSYSLLANHKGGVLYPPNSLKENDFVEKIFDYDCSVGIEFWLKLITAMNGYRVVVPQEYCRFNEVQMDSLYGDSMSICEYLDVDKMVFNVQMMYKEYFGDIEVVVNKIRQDRFA